MFFFNILITRCLIWTFLATVHRGFYLLEYYCDYSFWSWPNGELLFNVLVSPLEFPDSCEMNDGDKTWLSHLTLARKSAPYWFFYSSLRFTRNGLENRDSAKSNHSSCTEVWILQRVHLFPLFRHFAVVVAKRTKVVLRNVKLYSFVVWKQKQVFCCCKFRKQVRRQR